MIILQKGFESIEEYLSHTGEESGEIQRECPECGGRLWKNGSYRRVCLTLQFCVVLRIQRVICKNCGKSGSCLYEFLIPYKRYEGSIQALYVHQLFQSNSTYRNAAWCDEDGERNDAEASLSRAYRAVSDACDSAENLLQQIQQVCIEEGVVIPEIERKVTTQQKRARTLTKKRLLGFLVLVLQLLGRLGLKVKPSWVSVKKYMSRGYALPELGFRLSAPQTLKQALF